MSSAIFRCFNYFSLFDMSRFFLLLLSIIFISSSASSAANSNIYLVEKIGINGLGKSPTDARNKAVDAAHKDAFAILLSRLNLDAAIIDKLSDEEISDMVRSEQIDNERIAGNNYSAIFNIMFAKDFVDHILSTKKLNNAKKLIVANKLLIPIKEIDGQIILWEENNDWKNSVERVLAKKFKGKTINFSVPQADIESISSLNRDNVTSVRYRDLESLLLKHNSGEAYIMLFSYNDMQNKVTINVSHLRKLQKKNIKLSFVNIDHLKYDSLLDKVAEKTINYLASTPNDDDTTNSNLVRMHIPISNLNEWLSIKKKIENSPLVREITLESVSRDYALILVDYNSPKQEISEHFDQIGLNLDKKAHNVYILTEN